ncbi:MAG: hypothetical protein WCY10_01535 [Candidatus Omnitrophota bacterium]
MKDPFDEIMEYDFSMGADAVNCPHCGAVVGINLFFDDEVECPHCGSKFENEG